MAVIGGGGIKSIQRGSTAVANATGGTTTTATINAVDLAKSFISASTRPGYNVYYPGNVSNMVNVPIGIGATLTNTTTISFSSNSYVNYYNWSSTSPTIYWEVIEYE